MSFTAREQALDVYQAAKGMGRGKVHGADMEAVTRGRLEFLDQASRLINRAIGTDRILLREPPDDQLQQMAAHVTRLRDAIAK